MYERYTNFIKVFHQIYYYILLFGIESLANHNETMFHLTRVTEEKKSLQRSLNEYINNHCNCDKVYT